MSDGPPPPHQGGERTAKGGVQALDVCRVDDGARTGLAQDLGNRLRRSPHHPMDHADHSALRIALDHLTDEQPRLHHQPRPTATAGAYGMTEHLQKSRDVAGQAIDTDQHRQACRTSTYPLNQVGDEPAVAMLTDDSTQP